MATIKNTKVGDRLIIKPNDNRGYLESEWYVVDVYPNVVLCLDITGNKKRCFNYADLALIGKESCGLSAEQLKDEEHIDGYRWI